MPQNQAKNNNFIFIGVRGASLVRGVQVVSVFYGVKEDWDGGGYGGRFDFRCGELPRVTLNLQNEEKEVNVVQILLNSQVHESIVV